MKSERLKKLEAELSDLEKWMKLGLVPKKELSRHEEEINSVKSRIMEEKDRLNFLKESGDIEEYSAPRRTAGKAMYAEAPTMSGVESDVSQESEFDLETFAHDTTLLEEEKEGGSSDDETDSYSDDDDDPFSDRNRWKRGGIVDPDANDW